MTSKQPLVCQINLHSVLLNCLTINAEITQQ